MKKFEKVLLSWHSDTDVLNISNAPSTLLILTQLKLMTTRHEVGTVIIPHHTAEKTLAQRD